MSISSRGSSSACWSGPARRTHGRGGLDILRAGFQWSFLATARELDRPILGVLFFWGVIFWLLSGMIELRHRCPAPYLLNAELCFATVRLRCALERTASAPETGNRQDTGPVAAAGDAGVRGAVGLGGCAPAGKCRTDQLAAGVRRVLSRCQTARGSTSGWLRVRALHSVSLWLLALLPSWELKWQVHHLIGAIGSWSGIAWPVVPALLLWLLPTLADHIGWPFGRYQKLHPDIAVDGLRPLSGALAVADQSVDAR